MRLSEIGYILRGRKWLPIELYPDKVIALIKYLYLKLQIKDPTSEALLEISNSKFNIKTLDYLLKNMETEKIKRQRELFFLLCSIETIRIYENERKIKFPTYSTITASDISSFTFCPASYAIGKSYYIIPNWKTSKGSKFHEAAKLIDFFSSGKVNLSGDGISRSLLTAKNKSFFDAIGKSNLYYSGHSPKDRQRFFKSKNFVCQPDYIFIDSNGEYFVVEEKYKFSGDDECYFINHQLQCASYIYGIHEIEIAYGYLIYWKTSYTETSEGTRIQTVGCDAKKIERTSKIKEMLISTFKEIQGFNSAKIVNFNIENINVNKCINCSVAAICGHKYARFSSLKLPYYEGCYNSIQDINVSNELKHSKTALDLFWGKNLPCQICYEWLPPEELQSKYVRPIMFDKLLKRYTKFEFTDVSPNKNAEQIIDITKFGFFHSSIKFDNHHDFAISVDNYGELSNALDVIFHLGNVCNNCASHKEIEIKIKPFEIKYLEKELVDSFSADLNQVRGSLGDENTENAYKLFKNRKFPDVIEILENLNCDEKALPLSIAYYFDRNFAKSMFYVRESQNMFNPSYEVFAILIRLNEGCR